MFLALRDLAQAKGRFTLIGSVVALVTTLVVLLTGLTAGLGHESVSAIDGLERRGVDRIVFSAPPSGQKVGFDSSRVTSEAVTEVRAQPGVRAATTLGIVPARAQVGARQVAVTVFVIAPGAVGSPIGVTDGSVVVGARLAEEGHLASGDRIRLSEKNVRISRLSDDASYQHLPVVWMTAADAAQAGLTGGGPQTTQANVILVRTTQALSGAALARLGLVAMSPSKAVGTIESYRAENGSLSLMRAMLLLVSALVVGAFFTVWTMQRTPDLAVLKAIGASTGTLVRDALGQALVVLLAGGTAGAALALVGGLLARSAVPIVVSAGTVVTPVLLLVVLGALGTLVSLRRITTIDPNTALGASR